MNTQRPPCPEHGLASGPDGRCTLCKRSKPPLAFDSALQPEQPFAARIMTLLLGACAVLSIGIALCVAFGLIELDGLRMTATEPTATAPIESDRATSRGYGSPQRGLGPTQHAQQAQRPVSAADPSVAAPMPRPVSEPLDSNAAIFAEQQRRRADEEAAQDKKRHAAITAEMDARALKQARERVSIVMYSTTWCPTCVSARKYMTEQAIPFTDFDVEASPSASAIHHRLNPKGSIPTIDVDGDVLVGFSGAHLEDMIDAAAKKRLR